MDIELIKKYLNMFKISLIIFAVALLTSIGFLTKIVTETIKYSGNRSTFEKTQKELSDKENTLNIAKENKAKLEAQGKNQTEIKKFFKNIKNTGNSTADILADEIQEINDLIKYYNLKVYKVNYNYDSDKDAFYKGKKDTYNVCYMNMELFGSYMKFQSFLKDLYKHEHFLDIQGIEINPYKKDKSILHIRIDLGLYAEKDLNAGKNREVPPTKNNDSSDLNLDINF